MNTKINNSSSAQSAKVINYWETPEYAYEKARTAVSQIFAGVGMCVFFSWGVSKQVSMFYKGMPTLALRVSGLVHDGWVLVSLNEGSDLYEVRLKGKTLNSATIEKLEEVYCDQLGSTIDSLVERPPYMTDDEYKQQSMKDSVKKMLADRQEAERDCMRAAY